MADLLTALGNLKGFMWLLLRGVWQTCSMHSETSCELCGSFSGDCGSGLRSCVKVEAAVLGSLSQIVLKQN